jgi:hemerythrin-like domain-containing protein
MHATEVFEAIRAFGEHEHRDLARGLDRIHEAARTVGGGVRHEDTLAIREVLAWSATTLQPHIAWEEAWLYPQIDALTGCAWSTRAARVDHAQIQALALRLRDDESAAIGGLSPATTVEVRGHLFAYEALLRAHIDREEQLLLPVLAEEAARAGTAAGEVLAT